MSKDTYIRFCGTWVMGFLLADGSILVIRVIEFSLYFASFSSLHVGYGIWYLVFGIWYIDSILASPRLVLDVEVTFLVFRYHMKNSRFREFLVTFI